MSKKSFKLLLIGAICLVLLGNFLIFIDSDDPQILVYSDKTVDGALPVTRSSIENYGGVPTLFINGEPQPALAYMTYFQENNEYESFTLAGYELFSLPVFFSTRGINTLSNISPFEQGIFEIKGEPNFEIFDQNIETILEQNSNAYILPRMNISMPTWWEEENPTEVNITEDGESKRESFYSEKWRKDAGELVLQFIKHINQSDYRDRILGYQIACGNTEEWFHFDLNGGIGPAAERGFEAFIKQMYPDEVGDYDGLPKFKSDNEMITDDLHHRRFLEFCSLAVADAISYFSGLVKEATNYQLIVGTFYGYGLEVYNSLYGTHALNYLLDNENIDFFCSPNSYQFQRKAGIDWPDMTVTDSMKLHNKFYFAECDIRTSLTKWINDSREGAALEGTYNSELWFGPKTIEDSLQLIRKTFTRQLIKGNGLWWFDMWGGWFENETIMEEMKAYEEIATVALHDKKRESVAKVAVFTDEAAYQYLNPRSQAGSIVSDARHELGLTAVPYDSYDLNDFESVYKNYEAIIFLSPVVRQEMQQAINLAQESQIATLSINLQTPELSVKQLRDFYKDNEIHIWCKTDDVIYVNDNFIAVHAATSGKKTLNLDRERNITQLLPQETNSFKSDQITVEMNEYETILFRLED
ncbi:hypothetical protein [Turicibacter bilis]|uniref:hypothetical protein n=1 Tax=Turicibacter bilis TaxID=2735723 RepID=UPI003F8A549E